MRTAGFDVVNLANNHADDFGQPGLDQTLARSRKARSRWTGRPGQITLMRRKGLRIALLGFAPYRGRRASSRSRVAQALVRKAATQADLVVVAMHAGAEGSAAMHVPHGTETFLGENRGDSRRFSHAVIDAGADLVVGLRAARDPRRRALPRAPDRVLARQLRRLQELRTGGMLSLSAILRVSCARRLFVGGHWISLA